MHKLVGVVVIAGSLLATESVVACSFPAVRLLFNQTTERTMTVRSGRPCSMPFGSSLGPVHNHEVMQRPSHGQASAGADGAITYRSHPGYVGKDVFVYARRGLDKWGNAGAFKVRVLVRVRP